MESTAVITGIGFVLPEDNGQGADLLKLVQAGNTTSGYIYEEALRNNLPDRLWDKIDSFTRYALIATEKAIADADLNLDSEDMTRCGCFVGNCFGGWKFTERELDKLYNEGARMVSPYQATSWFPAAVQGQLTIAYGVKGFSKTYMLDRASSLQSIISAAQKINHGELDIAIAGGTESTNTTFIKTVLKGLDIKTEGSPWEEFLSEKAFKISEGAVFVILESEAHAKLRQKSHYAKITGFGMNNYPCPPDKYCSDYTTILKTMKEAAGENKHLMIYPDFVGDYRTDYSEMLAISENFSASKIDHHKAFVGHTFGAEGALDVAMASVVLNANDKPKTPVLINAKALGGMCISLLIERS